MKAIDYLHQIIEGLCEKEFTIEERTDEKGLFFQIRCDKSELGRLIGAKGVTINAVRSIMHTYGSINEAHISVKVDANEG